MWRAVRHNEERIQHLEKGSNGGNYDTGSPQEREDTRRLQLNDKNYL